MRRREFLALSALAGAAARRAFAAEASRAAPRIVVAGGGFAGSACALHLKRLLPRAAITLIDPDARYVSCPLSNEVLVGARTLASLTRDRRGIEAAGVRFVAGRVASIDADARRVRLDDGDAFAYDRLVVAPGIRFRRGTPEGYDEAASRRMPHAWKAGAQTRILAGQIEHLRAGGTIAISVPAGLMRCPPGPYERASLIADVMKRRGRRAKILIFDANNRFPRQDAFTAAWRERYGAMIEWIPVVDGGAVERVDAKTMTLFTASGAHRVDVANVIPAQAPGEIAKTSGLASGHGWCPVDPDTFESGHIAHVHVIGDACIAGAMPKAASAAVSQARRCADAIAASLTDRAIAPSGLDSVCYSFVARDRALAIHGRFAVSDGAIRSIEGSPGEEVGDTERDHAKEAEAWFAKIRTEAFGA